MMSLSTSLKIALFSLPRLNLLIRNIFIRLIISIIISVNSFKKGKYVTKQNTLLVIQNFLLEF